MYVIIFKIHCLSKFQVNNSALLTTATIVCTKFLEFIDLITKFVLLDPRSSAPGNHYILSTRTFQAMCRRAHMLSLLVFLRFVFIFNYMCVCVSMWACAQCG